ncbi:MAG TPA: tyrosine-type recombinase/integrase, partial [Prevotella sp.]|nr:tyrosine-type recombinase/integrase [Prevotella sp.]
HLSRHSFATNALNNGMRIEHVSKLMDHTNISTTQIYADLVNAKKRETANKISLK